MKIISTRPAFRHTCENCNSIYEVEEKDVTAQNDKLDFSANWTCPVCGNVATTWLYMLPHEWRDPIKQRCNL